MGAPQLDEALSRMREAMDRLQAAIDIRRRKESSRADADEEFALMQDDRARLAVELDGALAENRSLSAAHSTAAGALARAATTIEDLLAQAAD